jgi:hypothetical protein
MYAGPYAAADVCRDVHAGHKPCTIDTAHLTATTWLGSFCMFQLSFCFFMAVLSCCCCAACADRQASGSGQPREHFLLSQAFCWTSHERGHRGVQADPIRGRYLAVPPSSSSRRAGPCMHMHATASLATNSSCTSTGCGVLVSSRAAYCSTCSRSFTADCQCGLISTAPGGDKVTASATPASTVQVAAKLWGVLCSAACAGY